MNVEGPVRKPPDRRAALELVPEQMAVALAVRGATRMVGRFLGHDFSNVRVDPLRTGWGIVGRAPGGTRLGLKLPEAFSVGAGFYL